MRMCELRLEGGDRAFHAERVDRAEVKVQSHSACSRDGRAAGVQRAEGASGQGGGHAAGGRRVASGAVVCRPGSAGFCSAWGGKPLERLK